MSPSVDRKMAVSSGLATTKTITYHYRGLVLLLRFFSVTLSLTEAVTQLHMEP